MTTANSSHNRRPARDSLDGGPAVAAASENGTVSHEDTHRTVVKKTGRAADGTGTDTAIGHASEGSSVHADTAEQTQDEQGTEPTRFTYTPEERTAIDHANEAITAVIKAADTFEDIEA